MHFINSLGRILVVATAVLSLAASQRPAHATEIHYIVSGSGTGSLGGTPFNNQPFAITTIADTAGVVQANPFTKGVDNSSLQVQVGATSATGTFPGASYAQPAFNGAVFAYSEVKVANVNDIDLFNFYVQIPSIPDYNLVSAIGPLPADEPPAQPFIVITNLGTLDLTSASGVTFQAVLIPEPSAILLSGLPLLLISSLRRRKD
jgi:hypothetical protein